MTRHGGTPTARTRRRLQLAEGVDDASAELSPDGARFLAASRRAERRARWTTRAMAIGALLLAASGASVYVRAARTSEREALERARTEEGKRRAIEEARAEASEKQATIDRLVHEMSEAKDDATVLALQRQLKEASSPTEATSRPSRMSAPRVLRALLGPARWRRARLPRSRVRRRRSRSRTGSDPASSCCVDPRSGFELGVARARAVTPRRCSCAGPE